MLNRNGYLKIIEELRNIESISLDEYIEKELLPLKEANKFFIETLYKDIYYILQGVDKPGDNDLVMENGDFVFEDNDLKLTGYQTRLHDVLIWLHMEMIEKYLNEIKSPIELAEKIENFETNFLDKQNYTPEYKTKLDKIKKSIRVERKQNGIDKTSLLSKLFSTDNLELKPNIAGFGININEIINKFKK